MNRWAAAAALLAALFIGETACCDPVAGQGLQAVTPAYPAPYPEFSADWTPLPVRLLGVDLAQGAASLTGDHPALNTAVPLSITCYWLAQTEVAQKRGLELKVASHDGQISRAEEVKAGPDDQPWQPGSVYKQTFEFTLAPVASTITGDSFLLLSVFPRQQSAAAPVALQRVPLQILPTLRPGRISERSLASAIKGAYDDLSVSFRLGKNARLTLDVPPDKRAPAAAIAVISSESYGSTPQDQPVCEIVAKTGGSTTHTFYLRSGVDTARSDIDFYAPGAVNHKKANVIESWDAEYPDVFNKPFKKHAYLTVLVLPAESQNLASIEFISKSPYVLDIFDVVLVRP